MFLKKISLLLAAALLVSCSLSELASEKATGLLNLNLTALSSTPKTVMDSERNVLWQEGDQVSVFDGFGNRLFRTAESGESVSFGGSASTKEGLIMSYPYNSESYREGDLIYLSVPAEQTATPGSFPRGANVTLSKVANDGTFYARNLCGLICLKFSRTDVVAASVTSLGGSALAGKVCVEFDADDIPLVSSVVEGASSVTIKSASGDAVAPGSYYIPVLPGEMSDGISIKLTLSNGVTAVRTISSSVSVVRSKVVEFVADTDLSYEKDEERIVVIYGDSITHINVFNYLQSLLDTKAGDVVVGDTLKHVYYRVVMAGRSGERPLQITCRQGALPLYAKGPFTLSKSAGSYSSIGEGLYTTMNENAEDLGSPQFLINVDYGKEKLQGYTGCTNPFVIDGRECTIKCEESESTSTGKSLSITRNRSWSEDVYYSSYVRVQTHVDYKYSNPYISTVYMGTNGKYILENLDPSLADYHTWSQLGDFVQLMLDHAPKTKWVVCGYHSKARWTEKGSDYMSDRFGDVYIDLKREGIKKVNSINARIGYTMTEQDKQYLENDEWPAGWQDLNNIIHPSPTGHMAYATLMFEKMEELGYL